MNGSFTLTQIRIYFEHLDGREGGTTERLDEGRSILERWVMNYALDKKKIWVGGPLIKDHVRK